MKTRFYYWREPSGEPIRRPFGGKPKVMAFTDGRGPLVSYGLDAQARLEKAVRLKGYQPLPERLRLFI